MQEIKERKIKRAQEEEIKEKTKYIMNSMKKNFKFNLGSKIPSKSVSKFESQQISPIAKKITFIETPKDGSNVFNLTSV